jgi:integrase
MRGAASERVNVSIQIFCMGCKTGAALDAKTCPKCKKPFGRERKFRVQVSVKGQRTTRVVDNLTIARELEASIKADMVREEFYISHHKAKQTMTLQELWERYLPWAQENKKTWKCDQYNYETHLKPRWGSKALDTITSLDVERLKLDLKRNVNKFGRPFTPATIKHQLVLLNRLYNLAKRWRLYSGTNPMDHVEVPKLDNQKTEFLTDEELVRLLEVLDNWPYDDSAAFIKFALFTGFRRSELFKMQWTHVDFERGMITLPDPKGKKTVTVPVCQQAFEVLNGLHKISDFVFPGRAGEQRTDFKGPWQRIRKAAGLPKSFRFHGIRHHFASTLVSNGVDLAVVQGLLSHKDSRTTARYSHLLPGALKQAANKAGELLQPKRRTNKVR